MAQTETRWIVLSIAGAVAFVWCGSAFLAHVRDGSPEIGNPAGSAAAATIGTAVRDGQLEFTVNSVGCSRSKAGDARLCLVNVQVRNIGGQIRRFDSGNQWAIGVRGARFGSGGNIAVSQINPGDVIVANLVFDIGIQAELLAVELHDGASSGGVTVSLWPAPGSAP